ncbi:MAG TPA: TetR/AcrR family transcriptional regulator [Methylomirabilota bacterium]|nr:TetR/AcrR family transcriptional regulator [Methylomirabilota bacterium]
MDTRPTLGRTRAARREGATAETRAAILGAARGCLLEGGYATLSTRRVADAAGVPLSQIHYHFGSKQQLILAVLAAQTERLLERQAEMYAGPEPLWVRWQRACDFLEADLKSGYVRILQELIAAGWSDPELAASVRDQLAGWFSLLTAVAQRTSDQIGGFGPFTPSEVATLMGLSFVGAESAILLGMTEDRLPTRSALHKLGDVIREIETTRWKEHADGH